MRRRWPLSCLLLLIGCIDGSVRSGSLALPGDETTPAGSDGERPTLVVRCESGHLSAYLVTGGFAGDSAGPGKDAVLVELDSAPPCSDAAP